MRCRIEAFIGTWLDPFSWLTRLRGADYSYDGHTYDDPRYELRGDREYEFRACVHCGREVEQGWRRSWRVA